MVPLNGRVVRVANVGVKTLAAAAVGLNKRSDAALRAWRFGLHQARFRVRKKGGGCEKKIELLEIPLFSDGKATHAPRQRQGRGSRPVFL